MPERLVERARAKVNLTLSVLGRRPDGYHELESLVAFAAVGDILLLEPGPELALRVDGPGGDALGPIADNLVLRAAQALARRRPGLVVGWFTLTKRLPVAAGLGGGSSDAAAALRCLARANHLSADDPDLLAAAVATGADVPVCLDGTARWMAGAGERLSAPVALARLPAVLVNPGEAIATTAVFAALGLAPGSTRAEALPRPPDLAQRDALLACLAASGNDLAAPAIRLVPVIETALDHVRSQPGCRLARMSGSGATVFGLFGSCRQAATAARALRAAQPGWWVVTTMLS